MASRFRMVSELAEKDYVTLGNVACGLAALVFAASRAWTWAFGAVVAAMAFDFLDGQVARSGKVKTGANELGKQLDSLSDAVSFGAVPAFTSFMAAGSLAAGVASVVYVCAAVVRLAHFNVQEEKGVFYGLPSPLAALLVMAAVVVVPRAFVWVVVLVAAVAMVAGVRVKKPFYKPAH